MKDGDLLVKGSLPTMGERNERLENEREAFALLGLIDAEFRSDPMSVQCFDLSIVARVRECVRKHEGAT